MEIGGDVSLVSALLAAAGTARMAFDAVAATYVLLAAAFVPPLLAAFVGNRRARR